MNYTKKTDYFDIHIEPNRNTIVIRQKWKYNWYVSSKEISKWTYLERRDWHHKADNVIWNQWGSKYTFMALVREENDHNKYLHRKEFNIEFDIQWVTNDQHWTANIYKIKPVEKEKFRSQVNTNLKTIQLSTFDLHQRKSGDINQNTLKHEFGHTIKIDDEYGKKYGNRINGPYSNDTKALMNIGNELRQRYIYDVKREINGMITGVNFVSFL
ncbi:hypothetical protein OAT18_00030 [Tenacibaculum sp.]|nr:hypothetical protein [Tenacibaculum sp.]